MAITVVGVGTYVLRLDANRVARLFRIRWYIHDSQHTCQELGLQVCLLTHARAPAHDVSSIPTFARTYHCPNMPLFDLDCFEEIRLWMGETLRKPAKL